MKRLIIFCFFSQLLMITTAHGAPPVNDKDCRALFLTFCTGCHGVENICKNLPVKNKEQWSETVAEMASYADYDKEITDYVLRCISSLKPGSKVVCKKK
ncbi:MAG: hypothetical protein ABFS19_05070 [Thermodesulfobacteriota bacterium]